MSRQNLCRKFERVNSSGKNITILPLEMVDNEILLTFESFSHLKRIIFWKAARRNERQISRNCHVGKIWINVGKWNVSGIFALWISSQSNHFFLLPSTNFLKCQNDVLWIWQILYSSISSFRICSFTYCCTVV